MGKDGFNWFIGVIESRQDPEHCGRVRVRCLGHHTDDTNFDSRDFTILIYMNPTWLDYNEGKLRYHIPRISIDGGSDKLEQAYTYSKHHYHDILPVFTNVVVMNHMNNDNIGALIRHEVTKTLHTENRYAVYSTYRKK